MLKKKKTIFLLSLKLIVLEQKNSNIGNEDNFKQRKFNKTIILKYKSLAVKQFFLFPSIILFQRF